MTDELAHFLWKTAASITLGFIIGYCIARLRRDEEPWWLSAWFPASVAVGLFGVLLWVS